MRFSKHIIKSDAQKNMAISIFGRIFHDFKYFEVGSSFHIPCIHYTLKGIVTKFHPKK